jgi:hypothetical protein
MPRYIIERQYLVPVYEHVLIEAQTLEDACRRATDDIEEPWGDDVRTDYESSGPTTIQLAVEVPEPIDLNVVSLSHLLYNAGLEVLSIPDTFADEGHYPSNGVGFV